MNKVIRKSIAPPNTLGVLQVKVMSVRGAPECKAAAVRVALHGISKSSEKKTKSVEGKGAISFAESLSFEFPANECMGKEEAVSLACTLLDSDQELSDVNINLGEVNHLAIILFFL